MRTLRLIAFAILVGSITAVMVVVWHRSDGLLQPPEGCSSEINGNITVLDTSQSQFAALIAAIGVRRGLPARAVSIALATAYQESKIRNLPGGDRDSLGLFQQRPSQGWGTSAEILDPVYATNAFYDALEKIPHYQSLAITVAAQEVQRSAYPSAYAQHEPDARRVASALTGYSPATFSCVVSPDGSLGSARDVIDSLKRGYGSSIAVRRSVRQNVAIDVGTSQTGRTLGWSVAQYAVAMASGLHIKAVTFDGRSWRTGAASSKGWVPDQAASASTVSILME